MRNILRGLLAIAVCSIAITSPAHAQSTNSGDIRGTVMDQTGAILPDATVTVLDNDKGVTKVYHSNKTGLYDTGPIVTGNYRITFEKDGFAPFIRSSVNLQVGIITIDGKLSPGTVNQEVVVTTDVPLIKTESGEQSTILEAREMQKRPNVGQDWQNFVREIPGATGTASYGSATGQALSINGNLPYNSVMADGASSTLSHSGNADVAIFETVQEVQINTNAFSAQYGIGGAIFNQITKGGSNQFHGTLYEYAQNDAFNARNFFAVTGTKPYVRYHNFGGSVGGPALKDKLFFFFDYDQTINKSASSGYQSVPTQAMRNGDFSAFLQNGTNNQLYAPVTGTLRTYVDANGKMQTGIDRPAIAGNLLTSYGPLDPVALNIQKLIPLPNINTPSITTTNSAGITSSNYYYTTRGSNPFRKYFGRADYDLTSKNRITASVTQHDNPAFFPGQFPDSPLVGAYNGDVDGYNAQITDVWNISNRTINEARFGYTNQLNFYIPVSLGTGLGPSLGIPSLKGDSLPSINISSYNAVYAGGVSNAVYKEHDYDPSDVVTMIRGKHVMHFGGEYLILQDNSTAWGNVNVGTYAFTGTYSSCTYCVGTKQTNGSGVIKTSGNSYADFLLGALNSVGYNNTPEFAGRQKAPQMFFQDDWKIKPNLTVNLGLRYQVMQGWSDNKGNQRTFDPLVPNDATGTMGGVWYASTKAHGRTQLQDNVYDTVLPRVGFAWQIHPGMVIRGGYGLYAYLWSLDTYGYYEGNAFGNKGTTSDTTNGLTSVGKLSTSNNFTYIGVTQSNAGYNGTSLNYTDQTTPPAKIQQYNITMERQIGSNMSASLAYVGSRSFNLNFNRDINQVPVGKLAVVDQQFRPYPQYTSISGSTYNADANYNSMQATFNRRLTKGITFQVSYVWSKFLDEYDSSAWGSRNGTTTYQNSNDVAANYGPSNFDTRNAFKGTASYVLPFGHGQMFFNKNNIVDEVIGGWQLSTNFVLQSGTPFTVTVPSSVSQSYAGSGNLYPNYIGNPALPKGQRSRFLWYNPNIIDPTSGLVLSGSATSPSKGLPAAFAGPSFATFGNTRRNSLYGPGIEFLDLSLGKTFNLYKDRYRMQIRIDANNALNHPVFANPSTSLTGSSGVITGTQGAGRVIQLGGRFSF